MKRFDIGIKYPRWEDDGVWLEVHESDTGPWVEVEVAMALENRVAELEAELDSLHRLHELGD